MQGYAPVKHKSAQRIFSKFCMDMEILPPYTPLFLVDESGHIVNKKRLKTDKTDFESLYNLAADDEAPILYHKNRTCDAYAVCGKIDDGKNYIVVSKDKDGFSRCVVCSYSERGCIKLHDYIEKLCCYKDYLDSFANLAFSSMVRLPAKRLFRTKLSGAIELAELGSGAENDSERRISFPIATALDKLGAFVSKSGGGRLELVQDGASFESVVNVPEVFLKLVVSAMALVLRHSRNSSVKVSALLMPSEKCVRIMLDAKSDGKNEDVYEKALVSAFEARGISCLVRESDGEYSLFIDAPLEERAELVLSDIEVVSLRLDELLSEKELSDLYFTISDI